MNKNKIIEDTAISFLRMKKKEPRMTKQEIIDDFREMCEANNFMASMPFLARMARTAIGETDAATANLHAVVNVVTWVLRQMDMEGMIIEINEFLKPNGK